MNIDFKKLFIAHGHLTDFSDGKNKLLWCWTKMSQIITKAWDDVKLFAYCKFSYPVPVLDLLHQS